MIVVWLVGLIFFASFGLIVLRGAPYVPSRQKSIKAVLSQLPFKKGDLLIDLGSGDGALILQAAKMGYLAIGYELNPILNFIARWRCRGLDAKVYTRDFWFVKWPPNTKVVFVFLAGPYMKKFARKVKQQTAGLKQPIYLVSNGFKIPGLTPYKIVDTQIIYKINP